MVAFIACLPSTSQRTRVLAKTHQWCVSRRESGAVSLFFLEVPDVPLSWGEMLSPTKLLFRPPHKLADENHQPHRSARSRFTSRPCAHVYFLLVSGYNQSLVQSTLHREPGNRAADRTTRLPLVCRRTSYITRTLRAVWFLWRLHEASGCGREA